MNKLAYIRLIYYEYFLRFERPCKENAAGSGQNKAACQVPAEGAAGQFFGGQGKVAEVVVPSMQGY